MENKMNEYNALEIKNLSKEYPHFRLDRLNLTLPGGCIMGLEHHHQAASEHDPQRRRNHHHPGTG